MEQVAGSKLGKEYIKSAYCQPAYLSYMQSTSCKMLGWMKTSWNQDCQEKYHSTQICRCKKELKSLLMKVKEKVLPSENEDHVIWSHHFMASRWVNDGNNDRLYILGLQNHCGQ